MATVVFPQHIKSHLSCSQLHSLHALHSAPRSRHCCVNRCEKEVEGRRRHLDFEHSSGLSKCHPFPSPGKQLFQVGIPAKRLTKPKPKHAILHPSCKTVRNDGMKGLCFLQLFNVLLVNGCAKRGNSASNVDSQPKDRICRSACLGQLANRQGAVRRSVWQAAKSHAPILY